MGLIDSMQRPSQQTGDGQQEAIQGDPGIGLAREATIILQRSGPIAAERIMRDGKADLDEMGEVAANLVMGAFRKGDYPKEAIATALPIVCITVAEFFDKMRGLDWMGAKHNAKAAARETLPRAIIFMKNAHLKG
jgi:hypothetical protein